MVVMGGGVFLVTTLNHRRFIRIDSLNIINLEVQYKFNSDTVTKHLA